uniref:Uncharacterized protein n=1 Tax=Globisporangium ultimum (strain ATCC 200006 / CBS 805.95 / DAOM BR144) TaxID=431595 RepID=K3WLH2_GLOUD
MPVLPDDLNPYLMSRAWIASYKAHLQSVQKKILQKPKKKKLKTNGGSQDKSAQETADSSETGDTVWQASLNEDITCVHGNLFLKKKKYRVVPASTWIFPLTLRSKSGLPNHAHNVKLTKQRVKNLSKSSARVETMY